MANYFKPNPEKCPNLYYDEDMPNIFIIPKGHCRDVIWYAKDDDGNEVAILGVAFSDKERPIGEKIDPEELNEKWTFITRQGFETPEQIISLIKILTIAAIRLHELQTKETKESERKE